MPTVQTECNSSISRCTSWFFRVQDTSASIYLVDNIPECLPLSYSISELLEHTGQCSLHTNIGHRHCHCNSTMLNTITYQLQKAYTEAFNAVMLIYSACKTRSSFIAEKNAQCFTLFRNADSLVRMKNDKAVYCHFINVHVTFTHFLLNFLTF